VVEDDSAKEIGGKELEREEGDEWEEEVTLTPPEVAREDNQSFTNFDDPYSEDPCFSTQKEKEQYMDSVLTVHSRIESDSEPTHVVFTSPAVRTCTCGKCTDLKHAGGDHICCRQALEKWEMHLEDEEKNVNMICVTDSSAFHAICNDHALRVFILSRWDSSGIPTKDPPQNEKFRHNAYMAMSYFLDGKKKVRAPLPSCVMTVLRSRYPGKEYTGFKPNSGKRKKKT
jgi:hypothetical protein